MMMMTKMATWMRVTMGADMIEIVTIGVYGFDADHFFQALQAAGVEAVCDIRQRRGVRGAAYAFANSRRLQDRLAALNIRYLHRPDLAPSHALRHVQDAADAAGRVAKRQRAALAPAFSAQYEQECLAGLDSAQLLADLSAYGHVIALLCVEQAPQACHRSLLAAHLTAALSSPVRHLRVKDEG